MVSKDSTDGSLNTPMMKQYFSMKEKYREEILFFRMGDFYEMFFDDAKVAADILGIALTSRSKDRNAVPMAGVPIRAVDSYLPKLLRAGKRVAICEQIQDPKDAQGIVERDVVRVVSPGTVTDDKLIGEKTNNFIVAVVLTRKGCGLSWTDLSTGEFMTWEAADESMLTAELARIAPTECVLPESLRHALDRHPALSASLADVFKTTLPDYCFDDDTAYRTLTEHFRTQTLEGFGCEHLRLGASAAGGLLHYLRETQKTALSHISGLRVFPSASHMVIDQATQRALEITETFRGGKREGTLLDCFDECATALGARRLREWLLKPLTDREAIVYRQEAVEFLVSSEDVHGAVHEALRSVHDLERIATKLSYGSANGRDLVALSRSLEALPTIASLLGESESRMFRDRLEHFGGFEELVTVISDALVDAPPLTIREGGMIRSGHSSELDELRTLATEGTQWLARYQEEEASRTGAPIKVGYNRVFGYYIEVTHAHSSKVPDSYIRKQTLKNAERYITPELKEFESKALHAKDAAMELEYRIFGELRDRAAASMEAIQRAARSVAEIDVVACFARLARSRGYVRPLVDSSRGLDIADGRHPVVERLVESGEFVPNSIGLDESNPIMVITGPNMAGKSTYIRQVALLVLLAHTGSFIPAASARIGVVDRIFTRVGAADDISRGQSTFMVEMHETANILNNATERSLLVLDEVGRGTSTFDGVSLAWAITEHLAEKLAARTLFATHYQELTGLALTAPLVRNHTFEVKEWNDEIVFLRRVIEGSADKSYGIHVARLAGIPRHVIRRAQEILSRLENQAIGMNGLPALAPQRPDAAESGDGAAAATPTPSALQLDLFQDANEPVLKELRDLDTDSMSPLEALVYLAELRKRIV